ncbi:MAG: hypothetical protein MSA25_07500 [Clostridiales bacterium]|nr:hypothetical protein [Clostridiales bacterium]
MKKGWRVIITIVLVAVLLGGVSLAVGYMTGAETTRIMDTLDARYNINMWIDWFSQVYNELVVVFIS